MEDLQELQRQKTEINKKIQAIIQEKQQKYQEMSEVVKDDNPYSRLMALKRMGVVKNYERIKQFSVLIVGVGGVGSVVAEMLTRCGIGKLILYDYDKVELANMNRLFYTPQQVGLTKVQAAKETLQQINPQVIIEDYNINITSTDGFEQLCDRITKGGLEPKRIDIVLSCVDNYAARMAINLACNELNQVWYESGVSEDAMSAHIQLIIPGETACFGCATPIAVVESTESQIKREGVCAASLPTTMGITAGFMAQNVLKYLLEFGENSLVLGYNALKDFFQNYVIMPNPDCREKFCQQRQKEKAEEGENSYLGKLKRKREQESQIKAASDFTNDWGIEIIDSNEDSIPKTVKEEKTENIAEDLQAQNLADLMAKFNNL